MVKEKEFQVEENSIDKNGEAWGVPAPSTGRKHILT